MLHAGGFANSGVLRMRIITRRLTALCLLLAIAAPLRAAEESARIKELEDKLAAAIQERDRLREELANLRLQLKSLQRPATDRPADVPEPGKGWIVKVIKIVGPNVRQLGETLAREKSRLVEAEQGGPRISDHDRTLLRERVARLQREYEETAGQYRTLFAQTDDGQSVQINATNPPAVAIADKARPGGTYLVHGTVLNSATGLQIRLSSLTEMTDDMLKRRAADRQLVADAATARGLADLLASLPGDHQPASGQPWDAQTTVQAEQWFNANALDRPLSLRLAYANSTPRTDGKITISFNECTVEIGRFTYRLNVQATVSTESAARASRLSTGSTLDLRGRVANIAISPTQSGALFDVTLNEAEF